MVNIFKKLLIKEFLFNNFNIIKTTKYSRTNILIFLLCFILLVKFYIFTTINTDSNVLDLDLTGLLALELDDPVVDTIVNNELLRNLK